MRSAERSGPAIPNQKMPAPANPNPVLKAAPAVNTVSEANRPCSNGPS